MNLFLLLVSCAALSKATDVSLIKIYESIFPILPIYYYLNVCALVQYFLIKLNEHLFTILHNTVTFIGLFNLIVFSYEPEVYWNACPCVVYILIADRTGTQTVTCLQILGPCPNAWSGHNYCIYYYIYSYYLYSTLHTHITNKIYFYKWNLYYILLSNYTELKYTSLYTSIYTRNA